MTNFAQFISPVAWIIFSVTILFFAVVSVVLNYHWVRYGIDEKSLTKVRFAYFGVSGVLVAVLLFLALLV